MKHIYRTIAICCLFAISAVAGTYAGYVAQAQETVTVSGKVVDENGLPVMGAGVIVEGTTTGTATDLDGNFDLKVPLGCTLQVISIGYETVSMTVGKAGNLGVITLPTEQLFLDQVVVIGYGSQKKADLTGSVSIVDADELKKVSNPNISTMIEGKVAGVQITSDGQPGADPTVRIRGVGSFGSTAPLYVIDGVPMGTSIRDFSPNDIETIQVLKDASAAAIYGSRAANGVIIITTKSGKKNQPMKVDYRGYLGVDKINNNVFDVMDGSEYITHITSVYKNSGQALPEGYNPSSSSYLGNVNTNWFEEMFKTGIRQNHNVNLSGGGENNTYNIGLDYFSQKGTLKGTGPNYDRFTLRANNTMETKYVKFRTGVVYAHSIQDNMSFSNAGEYEAIYGNVTQPMVLMALTMPPTLKAYDESTWFLDRSVPAASGYTYDYFGYGTYDSTVDGDLRIGNPLLWNNLITRKTYVDRVNATGTAVFDILKMLGAENKNHSLTHTVNLSYNKTYTRYFKFVPAYIGSNDIYNDKSNETLTENYQTFTDGLIENYLTYDGKMGLHHLNVVAGITYERETYHILEAWGKNFPEPYYLQINNASTRDGRSYESEHALASYIGRINYDYDGRYLLQATVRRDGSSRLNPDSRWEWFPSFSAGWRIDKENFFNINNVSLLKLRASYGVLGNENIGEYMYMSTMDRMNFSYSFGGNWVYGSAPVELVNTNLRWEKKKTLDFGLDYAMFGGKLEINADWYRAISEDLLYAVAVPSEAGVKNTTVTMNAATMVNSGVELAASFHNYDHELKYDISGNISFPRNVVTKLGVSNEPVTSGFSKTEVGYEVGRLYGYVYEGIFQSQAEIDSRVNDNGDYVTQPGAQPGDVAYKDISGPDGVPDGTINAYDQTYLGSGMPKVHFGLSFRLEYKGFDLNVATFGAGGFKVVDAMDVALRSSYGLGNKSTTLLNAWTETNHSTTIPRVAYAASGSVNNDYISSRFIQNGTYWKLSNVEIGYTLPDGVFGDYISSARVYLSGQNLYTLTAYKGYNIDYAGGTWTPGYNYCSYPTPLTVMMGINLSF